MNEREIANVRAIVDAHRRVIRLFVAQVCVGAAGRAVMSAIKRAHADDTGAAFVLAAGILVWTLVLAISVSLYSYVLATRMGLGRPALWAVVMFVPCVSLVGLLLLNSKATTWCRQQGLEVGLLGPTRRSLDQFEASARRVR